MVDKLTDQHVHEIKAVFNLFDKQVEFDSDITKPEMIKFFNKLGVYPSTNEMDELFNLFDSNGNGRIDFPEFLSLMTRHMDHVDKNDENSK